MAAGIGFADAESSSSYLHGGSLDPRCAHGGVGASEAYYCCGHRSFLRYRLHAAWKGYPSRPAAIDYGMMSSWPYCDRMFENFAQGGYYDRQRCLGLKSYFGGYCWRLAAACTAPTSSSKPGYAT